MFLCSFLCLFVCPLDLKKIVGGICDRLTNTLCRQTFQGQLHSSWNMCLLAQQEKLLMGVMQAISSDGICLRPPSQ